MALKSYNGLTRKDLLAYKAYALGPSTPKRPSAIIAAEGLQPATFLLYQLPNRLLLLFGVIIGMAV